MRGSRSIKGTSGRTSLWSARTASPVQACPVDAIKVEDGIVTIDEDECTACGSCVDACPFGVMRMEETAFKCDLCGGDPTCVKFCPMGAIRYEEPSAEQYEKVRKLLEAE